MENEKNIVLYIDDEEHNLLLFDLIFSENFNVITTLSTQEAREILKTKPVKVVISDLRMPDESGLEFINAVSPSYPNICFIILTAYLDVTSAMQAINQGHVYRYLLKPWDNNEIILAINNALDTYRLKTENELLVNELQLKNSKLEATLAELSERESQFYNIFSNTVDGIMMFNHDQEILVANPAFYSIFNFLGRDIKKVSDIFRDSNLEQFDERFRRLFNNEQLAPIEYDVLLSTGDRKVIEANSTIVKYSGEDVVLSVLRDITERKYLSQKILYEIVQAEDKERKRLATDLHDGLGPILSTLKMYIEWLADKSRNGNSEQILDLSYKTIQEAIIQLRTISHNLSPHILEKFGLIPALQSQLELIKATSPTQFELISNLKERLPLFLENALYRILKECINNTIKHSQAQKAMITFDIQDKNLKINYFDNGKGFDIKEISESGKGLGLYSIQNRVKSMNAEVQFRSEIGKGFHMGITKYLNDSVLT